MPERPDKSLEDALEDPGFTPGKRHFRALLGTVASGDEETARRASNALARAQNDVGPLLVERYDAGGIEAQRALTRLAGRLATSPTHTSMEVVLERAIASTDARLRRAAANAIGRARVPKAEALLLGALARETEDTVKPRIIEALGKIGTPAALDAIQRATGEHAGYETERAKLMASRTSLRSEPSRIATSVELGPVRVAMRCRQGLESVLLSEVASMGEARLAPASFGPGCVDVSFRGSLRALFAARTSLRFGFAGEPTVARSSDEARAAIVDALTSPPTLAMLRSLTTGPIRYRIAFGAGGKRRRLVWDAALEIKKRAPDLVNDPTDSVWEAEVIGSGSDIIRVELVPKLEDPRFTYRAGDLPAASHPTIAAALVRVAGARPDDVVWDPFVGSGLELAERALLGPYRALHGTDVDAHALEVARKNLEMAGARAELHQADALTFEAPGGLTAIITNPPMGRRVLHGERVVELLVRFLARAGTALPAGGRLVWMSPAPRETRRAGAASGLTLVDARAVDLGGLAVEMQHFRR